MRQLTNLNPRISALPLDKRGFPIPYFVDYVGGEPDFRVMDGRKLDDCYINDKCWVCGKKNWKNKTFVIGPMCGINRTSAEPPLHPDCALFSATNCPFLTRPRMVRNEKGLQELGAVDAAGTMLKRNPGMAMLWTVDKYSFCKTPEGGVLFDVGEPKKVEFYKEGRKASFEDIKLSVDTGLHHLEEIAIKYGEEESLEQAKKSFWKIVKEFV